ncbi:MAG TPA: DJ-1/PfpI family protein [Anaerolineales bacterium]|nr:DJ-1/PfpI family protein [Anaerolineales bacterium]
MTWTVGIYLYDAVEVLDFAGPFEVFSTAARVDGRRKPPHPPIFVVSTVGRGFAPIVARGGLRVQPAFGLEDHPPLDVLVLPGGVVDAEFASAEVITWIQRAAATTSVMASVCTGAFLLAQAGLLDGKRATTHWEDIPELRRLFPAIDVVEGRRWVDLDSIVTSAGISAGIDMSLHLVARLAGEDLARRTARQMQYDWWDDENSLHFPTEP